MPPGNANALAMLPMRWKRISTTGLPAALAAICWNLARKRAWARRPACSFPGSLVVNCAMTARSSAFDHESAPAVPSSPQAAGPTGKPPRQSWSSRKTRPCELCCQRVAVHQACRLRSTNKGITRCRPLPAYAPLTDGQCTSVAEALPKRATHSLRYRAFSPSTLNLRGADLL